MSDTMVLHLPPCRLYNVAPSSAQNCPVTFFHWQMLVMNVHLLAISIPVPEDVLWFVVTLSIRCVRYTIVVMIASSILA